MDYIKLQYSNYGILMQGIYNGQYLSKNQIAQVIFDKLQGNNLPLELNSPENIEMRIANFSEGWLKSIRSILQNKGINFTVTGDSYQYNLREDKMTQEQLRMQMLSGVITESEYKAKLQEDKSMDFSAKDQKDWSEKKSRMYDSWANSSNELKDLEDDLKKAKGRDDKEEIKRLNNRIAQKKIAIKTSKEEFKKLNESKDSLNEHYIAGGIVGIGAINQIPSREKSDYEMAFEHFLGERYETKFENREQDIEEGKEVEEPSLYEGDLNESNIDQMTAGIKDAFDAVRSLPLPDNAKLGMAKTGIGIATLNAIGQKISSGQNISPEGQARLQKAITTIKQATSIEEIEQALLDAVINYASTNKPESSLEEISMDGGQSISQIQDEWLQVTNDIARLAAEYKKPKPDMQAALALGDQLKAKARLKQKLENEINNNIAGNDRDIRLIITQLT